MKLGDVQTTAVSEFDCICVGGTDTNQRQIIDVYSKQDGRYAVYLTPKRVIILFAEDPLVQRAQRKRLSALAALRSSIDGALDDWRGRNPERSRLPHTARQFDVRVMAALVEALEGDVEAGAATLRQIESEIASERSSRARLSYLIWTMATAAAFVLLLLFVYNLLQASDTLQETNKSAVFSILTASIAGVLGTVYSIALGIKSREIRNDQRRLDHITDAVVRISIGVLAAFILETFLLSGAIRISFGESVPLAGGRAVDGIHDTFWPVELIAGFLAGFAERLVPDLLSSYTISRRSADPALQPPAPAAPPSAGDGKPSPEKKPVSTTDDPETPEAARADDGEDGCDVDLADERFVTPDEALPASSGGVARDRGGF